MYYSIQQIIDKINFDSISAERKSTLQKLVDYILEKRKENIEINLNFICTHNSRRSQFAQVWAKVASSEFKIEINSFSSGVEVTELNKRAIASLTRFGFKISTDGYQNPKYEIEYDAREKPIIAYSKLVEEVIFPDGNFAAIMTCSDADENCPIVTGTDFRLPIRYDDPKFYDDSPLEMIMYDYRSFQIATEMFYVFSQV